MVPNIAALLRHSIPPDRMPARKLASPGAKHARTPVVGVPLTVG